MPKPKSRQFRPMLAPSQSVDPAQISYPVLASPKYDGIRCVIMGGRAWSRALKPIPNTHIRNVLEALGPRAEGFDGELMLPYPAKFQDVTSAVMTHDVEPPSDWFFVVFDRVPTVHGEGFASRVAEVQRTIGEHDWRHIVACEHAWIDTVEALADYEAAMLEAGHEGAMLRAPEGPYKFGRATMREAHLFKLKRFIDGEAEIIAVLELQHNRNEAFEGELGQTKRRTLKSGKVDGGVMGKLLVRDLKSPVEFKIGTGFTAAQRALWWRLRDIMPGRIVRYRFQNHGIKDKPRIASFQGFRDRGDM